ncbi:MAG TPA: TonB-dependent receptor [Steroidobacteraceae bacterium]|nr:TonB-dependent receptor [Steroidobacteraceae bacterium]
MPAEDPAAISVDSLLRVLQAQGIDVIYSSELVPPQMRAPAPRPGRTPLEAATDALAANGLKLEPLAPQKYVVVRAAPPPVPAAAAEEPLQEISVYASRYSIETRTVAAPRALSGDDIDAVPGSHDDALRALKSLPGLASNLSGRPYIRGSLADDVLVRYDGITLLDPFHLKNYQSLISAIDPAAVERIEVFSGGFPVRYGTRSGGVIDVTPPQVDSGYENRAAISMISAGLSSLGRSERWPADWLLAIRRSTLDLLDPVEDGFGQPQFSDSLGRVRYHTEHGAWTLGWLLLDDRIELGQKDDEEIADARYRDEYIWLARDHEFSDTLRTRATAVLTASERHRSGLLAEPGVATGTLDDDTSFDRFELTNLWTYEPRDSVTWTLGAEMAASRAEYTYSRRAEYAPGVATAFARPLRNDLDFAARPEVLTYALHAAERQRWKNFEAELGLRLDGQHYNLGGDHSQISPRLNLRYDVDDRLRIYASVGRFAQAQHVEEWRAEEAQPEADAAQISVHTILGVTWEPSAATRWGVEAYSKRWTTVSPYFDSQLDPLSLTPDLAPDRIRITPKESEASGLELNFRREFSSRLAGWSTLSWARVADDIRAGGELHDVLRSWDQSLALTAGAGWQGSRLNLSVFGAWHRGWPRTGLILAGPLAAAVDVPLVLGGRNRSRWGDFYTLDLRASYVWPSARGEFSTVFEVTNATNRANDCCAILKSVGNGSLESDTGHWLPTIVNLGFSYRWRERN